MANTHGKDAVFKIEDATGTTLRDITPHLNSIEVSQENELADTTTMGSEGRTWKQGLTNGTINLQGLWDDTADTGSQTVLQSLVGISTTVGFEYGPEGSTTGMVKLSGECVLESYTESAPVGDMVSFQATLRISGSVTAGTWV
ncbi:MAG: hypothetical protein AB1679_14325 [Actinomycetota bacterium]|jgi:predicted secreted protein